MYLSTTVFLQLLRDNVYLARKLPMRKPLSRYPTPAYTVTFENIFTQVKVVKLQQYQHQSIIIVRIFQISMM